MKIAGIELKPNVGDGVGLGRSNSRMRPTVGIGALPGFISGSEIGTQVGLIDWGQVRLTRATLLTGVQ